MKEKLETGGPRAEALSTRHAETTVANLSPFATRRPLGHQIVMCHVDPTLSL